MKLALLASSKTIKSGLGDGGDICAYDVGGLPPGEHAKIAFFNYAWRILRWNDEWHGNWTGNYPTAEIALVALREELLGLAAAV
jgi:hypothetical protein